MMQDGSVSSLTSHFLCLASHFLFFFFFFLRFFVWFWTARFTFFFLHFFLDLHELLPPRLADQLGWFMIFGGGLELQSKKGPSLSSFFENLPPKYFLGLGGAGPP